MKVFDLHCDTIGECYKQGKSLLTNDMHFSLDRARLYDEYNQVFAIWITDDLRGKAAVDYFDKVADLYYNTLQEHSDVISAYSSKSDTPVKSILAVEGASACGGTADGIQHLYDRGVRLVTLTWNDNNEIAAGAFAHGGMTDFGRLFMTVAGELGIILDVSHLNRQSFKELTEIYSLPFIASHSNADIVDNYYGHKRNLEDWQIEIIRDRGGLIGLNFCSDFIDNPSHPGAESVADQIRYLSAMGCDDVIALGSDFDGCDMHEDMCGVEKMQSLYDKLLKAGIDENLLNKVFYQNAKRFFDKYLK
jgi:membrane dipeptidase